MYAFWALKTGKLPSEVDAMPVQWSGGWLLERMIEFDGDPSKWAGQPIGWGLDDPDWDPAFGDWQPWMGELGDEEVGSGE